MQLFNSKTEIISENLFLLLSGAAYRLLFGEISSKIGFTEKTDRTGIKSWLNEATLDIGTKRDWRDAKPLGGGGCRIEFVLLCFAHAGIIVTSVAIFYSKRKILVFETTSNGKPEAFTASITPGSTAQ